METWSERERTMDGETWFVERGWDFMWSWHSNCNLSWYVSIKLYSYFSFMLTVDLPMEATNYANTSERNITYHNLHLVILRSISLFSQFTQCVFPFRLNSRCYRKRDKFGSARTSFFQILVAFSFFILSSQVFGSEQELGAVVFHAPILSARWPNNCFWIEKKSTAQRFASTQIYMYISVAKTYKNPS